LANYYVVLKSTAVSYGKLFFAKSTTPFTATGDFYEYLTYFYSFTGGTNTFDEFRYSSYSNYGYLAMSATLFGSRSYSTTLGGLLKFDFIDETELNCFDLYSVLLLKAYSIVQEIGTTPGYLSLTAQAWTYNSCLQSIT